jgi:hypothetical protein
MATSAFGKAFRAARNAGDKEFTFNGKQYNTRLADEEPKKPKAPTEVEKKSEMASALSSATRSIGSGTSDLAKAKIKEASDKAARDLDMAERDESMRGYKPRYTPPGKAPKMTEGATYEAKPFKSVLPDADYTAMPMKKGGSVSSASKRADGIAQRGKTRGKMC